MCTKVCATIALQDCCSIYFIAHETKAVIKENIFILLQHLFYFIARETTQLPQIKLHKFAVRVTKLSVFLRFPVIRYTVRISCNQ